MNNHVRTKHVEAPNLDPLFIFSFPLFSPDHQLWEGMSVPSTPRESQTSIILEIHLSVPCSSDYAILYKTREAAIERMRG